MTVGIGLGLSNYTFSSAGGYWDWVHMCDDEGVDSTTAPANVKRSGPSSARDSAAAKQARFMESYFGR